jgi:hypothetical protein
LSDEDPRLTGTVEVTVRARVSRWLRIAVVLLWLAEKLGYSPSAKRQERIIAWIVDRTQVEVLEGPISRS